jgi:hypothetical protein
MGVKLRLPSRWLRRRLGHASFRGQRLTRSGCHKHWPDGAGNLALGHAWRRSRHLRLHPCLRPRGRTILQRAVAEIAWLHHATSCACMQNSAVDPHRVKDHGELSCHRHQGAFAPFRSRQPIAPCLERRWLGRFVITACMIGSSESWSLNSTPLGARTKRARPSLASLAHKRVSR